MRNTKQEVNLPNKVWDTLRIGQVPSVHCQWQLVQGCDFIYSGTYYPTLLLMEMAGTKSEVGEHHAGGKTESQAWKTGGPQSLDTCPMVPTLTAARLLSSALGEWPSGRDISSSWVLPARKWEQFPAFANFWVVSPTTILLFLLLPTLIIYATNSLHGTPLPWWGSFFPD